jgi:hypothetical protein
MRYFRPSRSEVLTMVENRNATRFPKEPNSEFAAIWYPKELAADVEVHDESLGGLGVIVATGEAFSVGMELGIVYVGEMLRAFVVHIQPLEDGRARLGLQCQQQS